MMRNRNFVQGILTGAALTYLFDARMGNRRRAVLRDSVIHVSKTLPKALGMLGSDLSGRSHGWRAMGAKAFEIEEGSVPEEKMVQRVRSRMGRFVSHPHAVRVESHEGRIVLEGPIITDEAEAFIRQVKKVPGVVSVEDRLERHDSADGVPALQGGMDRPGRKWEFQKRNWSPAFRLLAGAFGAGIAYRGLLSRGMTGRVTGILGLVVTVRSLTNLPIRRLFGIAAGRKAVEIRKHIKIGAPVESVFSFWTNYENFPRFMPHVEEVHDLGGGRSRWKIKAVKGIPLVWDAEISSYKPNEILAWRTAKGSIVGHTGVVRFHPEDGATHLEVQLGYTPPAGAVGDAFLHLLGEDPKHKLDSDLLQVKTLLEKGEGFAPGPAISVRETAEV